jgi:anti-sigma factor RsiW
MSCSAPLSWEALVDWWAGDLDESQASAVEEHLLGCDSCSGVASRVAATAEALRTMVPPVVGPERLQGLARAGVRILGADATVEVTLRSLATGNILGHMEDAPFDARRGAVYLACQRDYAQLDHDLVAEVRVGKEQTATEYTILHHF